MIFQATLDYIQKEILFQKRKVKNKAKKRKEGKGGGEKRKIGREGKKAGREERKTESCPSLVVSCFACRVGWL